LADFRPTWQNCYHDVLGECSLVASALLGAVLEAVAAGRPAEDDRTLLVARIS
jgi:hypothetical protein